LPLAIHLIGVAWQQSVQTTRPTLYIILLVILYFLCCYATPGHQVDATRTCRSCNTMI